jgi:polysaccharide biosynthesis transport protein
MTSSITPAQTGQPAQGGADDEIDLRQLAAALQRRWRLIAKVAGGTLLLSAAYAFLSKPVWEGEFQIVLASKESPTGGAQALLQANPGLAALVGDKGGQNKLETEVKVLESPSVLKPVFDFVKTHKATAGEDVDRWRYSDWLKDNLTIKLEKGTSVLNLTYQDSDRDLVLPALQRISQAYQAYSGRDRERGIAQAIRYLDQQISRYRLESVASLRRAQQFAIEQDLTALKGEDKGDAEVVNSLNIEAIRVQAANEIRNINEQLKQMRALSDDPEALMYLGSNIPELAAKGLPQTLDRIDTELASLRATFTDREDSIRRLKLRRSVLIDTLKRQTYGYLFAKRTAAQARLAAAERPKGVLIRYRELLREAARDEATLNRLESERQVLALEQARKQDPWELISTPTLLDKPVAPRKGRILALGLLAGLVLGSGAALVVDRRSGRVFAEDELQQLLPGPLLAHLAAGDPQALAGQLTLLARGSLAGSHRVALIPVGLAADSPAVQELLDQLRQTMPHTELLCSSDLVAASSCDHQLLITSPGAPTRPQLAQLRQQLELQGRPITGWLLLDATGAG